MSDNSLPREIRQIPTVKKVIKEIPELNKEEESGKYKLKQFNE